MESNILVNCPRCHTSWCMPAGLTQEQQKKCAELARSGSLSGAIDLLKNEVHMTPKDAKTAVSHVSKNGQICHWCQKALGSAGQIECGECRSLNFAW